MTGSGNAGKAKHCNLLKCVFAWGAVKSGSAMYIKPYTFKDIRATSNK